ncbi:phospholipid-translocating p-type flippase family protein, putative [Ichthyophthirius multifiliis]|uniref:Phospholipid-transporting ATPase n=1 Tax=Ichthyophthirius multifiliis TaxID=5932 RepID=G0QSH4_ICHMU|nr:phospholipid-translocating p-type flippase family protein, putative [Ichthyophthirius multifiliis]EGR31812.1 phospholipid-translocating p-type flippase family protein, putative [Ichthyophthirius multifiliis]|eukprot:XP_004035298.1 phospholipid-translocating p-type flippase family protein, putative [Ichthyophthirius multifiliis]
MSNIIKTSRYTLINFFPFSLLLQFNRYANIYFLVISVLQCISIISPLSPTVAVFPLVIVLSISMIREGIEDYYRHVSDNEQNYQQYTTLINQNRKQMQIPFADICVGDIIQIEQDQVFPADLLVLGSSLEGICYIETGALDGEKNLKTRSALAQTSSFFCEINTNGFINKDQNFQLELYTRKPDQDPNRFEGSIVFNDNFNVNKEQIPFNIKQLLPRGAFLRNTEYVYGVVVYTGMDTKIMLNSESSKQKTSDMEKKMNQFILCILCFQFICSFVMSACQYNWMNQNSHIYPYLYLNQNGMSNIVQSVAVFFSFFILFNTMIPISLVISLEIVKVAQSYFIMKDQEMFSAINNRWPRVLTCTINEELGQVEYIFSDKTGTLTQNQMQFKIAVVGNMLYGKNSQKNIKQKSPLPTNKRHQLTEFIFEDQNLDYLLKSSSKEQNISLNIILNSTDKQAQYCIKDQLQLTKEYFKLLGVAHECIVSKNKDPTDTNIYYQGPSPDEVTLVDAAYNLGFVFKGQTNQSIQMKILGKDTEILKINIFEFSSERKCMTIIIQDEGIYKMYIKGADNIIKDKLNKNIKQPFLQYANEQLNQFSILGLRTLLVGMKIMSKNEVEEFKKQYTKLSEAQNRDEEIAKLAQQYEKDFFLIGATAVEDKLQDGVPETINDLIRANIKIWMLTGDKLETAENIAKSCKLILNDFEIFTLNTSDEQIIKRELNQVIDKRFKYCVENKIRKCFLIEGSSLAVIMDPKNQLLKQKFVEISKSCESVVCCRVSPIQKAQVVRTIKEALNKITLAIGDGANDVNMIQEAHIGCGIYGNEGMRAVQSSDFAFGQFKCLWRLLLIHGRWSYIRISDMIIYFFYKNMIFTIPQFYNAFYSGFSSQTVFDDWNISLYNLIFTALPLIVRAILDQDVNYQYYNVDKFYNLNETDIMQVNNLIKKRKHYIKNQMPNLYYLGQKNMLFTNSIFTFWVIEGIMHGAIIYYISFWSVSSEILKKGQNSSQWSFSLIMFTATVLTADIKLGIHTKYWTSISYIAFFFASLGTYLAFMFLSEVLEISYQFAIPIDLVQTPHFYLVIFIIVCSIFVFDQCAILLNQFFGKQKVEQKLRKLIKKNLQKKKINGKLNQQRQEKAANYKAFLKPNKLQLKQKTKRIQFIKKTIICLLIIKIDNKNKLIQVIQLLKLIFIYKNS